MDDGDGSLCSIMEVLDSVYREVMLTTTSGKAIPPSSSETLSCVHWRGIPATPPKW